MIRRRLIAAVILAAAVAPPAAQARSDFYSAPTAAPAPAVAPPSAPAAPVMPSGSRASGSQDGFQWSDAGVGAGGAALLLGAGGAAWAIGQRRRKHPAVSG